MHVNEDWLYGQGLRYEDLVAAVDVVLTKPGYGIVSECIANDTAMVYTSRGRFAEYDVFVREMPNYLRCEFISQDDLHAGRWLASLERVMAQARPGMMKEAVEEIRDLLRRRRKVAFGAPDNFGISTSEQIITQFQAITGGVFALMVAISSVGLLIGGIGVPDEFLQVMLRRSHRRASRSASEAYSKARA